MRQHDGATIDVDRAEFALSPAELERFRQEGYIGPFKVYEPAEMTERWNSIRRALPDRSLAVYPDDALAGQTNIANYDRHLDVDLLSEHICRPQIVDRVASILGEDVICWRTEFFPKYEGDEGTDWHQASTFANASGTPQILWPAESKIQPLGGALTAWTAFTPSTLENGCLQLIPRTQNEMHYDETKRMRYKPEQVNAVEKDGVRRGFFGYDYRELQVDPNWRPDESQAFPLVMEPGECVIFWSTCVHGSLPHTGGPTDYRMGYAARYVPAYVDVYPDTELVVEYGGSIPLDDFGVVVVHGRDGHGKNRVVERNRRGFRFPAG